jgi:hypothetical protein
MSSDQEHYNLMYPIGKYESPSFIADSNIKTWINTIEETPTIVLNKVSNLSQKDLALIYRPHGWSIAQVVHHMCDSHANAFIRFKLALTEDTPTIKPYMEGLWADLADYDIKYLHHSLQMLEAIHAKWTILLKSMDIHDFHNKSYFHPESHKNWTLGDALGLYDWHTRHHTRHIQQAIDYQGSFV